jgi:energy-coupling factor transporter ATP-binding protein EcfA2
MDITEGGKTLRNLGSINVIIGKNGCGKSILLRTLDAQFAGKSDQLLVKYLSPERGGQLSFDAHVENSINTNLTWGANVRRNNRVDNFRQMSFAEFRLLETLVLRTIERDPQKRADLAFTFDGTIDQINALLENVKLVRTASAGFEVHAKEGQAVKREAPSLSSGESELLSVAIEILSFAYKANHPDNAAKQAFLLLDEPDVHLHPDLQSRLMGLLAEAVKDNKVTTIIATHSTAILGGLPQADSRVAFMNKGANDLTFRSISDELRRVVPVFGAHPLSNVFNQNPVLLVEGDDDARVWQQAVRSAQGHLKIWPCSVGDIQSLNAHEKTASEVIGSVYDAARAFSLRDRDEHPYEIADLPHVTRMRLNCRAAENLLLTDDVLQVLGTSWPELQKNIIDWIASNEGHARWAEMQTFAEKWDRRNGSIKYLRNTILGITGYPKDWEIAVGHGIAGLRPESETGDGSLADFVGPKVCQALNLTTN